MARNSNTRLEVLHEALSMFGADGGTREEIFVLIEKDLYGDSLESKRKSLSNALTRINSDEEIIVNVEGRYYLKEYAPVTAKTTIIRPDRRGKVAPYTAQAKGKTVSIFTSPIVLENVVGVQLFDEHGWHKIPLFGSIRVCIGREAPMWSPEQVTYTGVTRLRFIHKDSSILEENAAAKDLITIAPAE